MNDFDQQIERIEQRKRVFEQKALIKREKDLMKSGTPRIVPYSHTYQREGGYDGDSLFTETDTRYEVKVGDAIVKDFRHKQDAVDFINLHCAKKSQAKAVRAQKKAVERWEKARKAVEEADREVRRLKI